MKTYIDIKSALFGIVLGVLAMVAIGAGTSSKDVGRYQVSVGASFAIMADTQTGQAWCNPLPGIATRSDASFFEAK